MTLLAVGAVVPRKGYDVLIDALATLADLDWRLVIAGDRTRDRGDGGRHRGADRGRGPRRAGEHARRGRRRTNSPRSMPSADLFVLASRHEGYGMAFAEAINHGLPVVGTRAGAIPETVPAGAGILVEPDDAPALAAALRTMIADPRARETYAACRARRGERNCRDGMRRRAIFLQRGEERRMSFSAAMARAARAL